MDTLNIVAKKYLRANGIRITHFADYIGCDQSRCSRWLNGECRLRKIQIKKVHEFLSGNFLKSVNEIMEREGDSYCKSDY